MNHGPTSQRQNGTTSLRAVTAIMSEDVQFLYRADKENLSCRIVFRTRETCNDGKMSFRIPPAILRPPWPSMQRKEVAPITRPESRLQLDQSHHMSDLHIPQEICERIIDLLYDQPRTLRQCCLVSRSWVPRTRKYLFCDVWIDCSDEIHAWKNTFPDPLRATHDFCSLAA